MTYTEHTYLVCRAFDTDPRSRSRAALLAHGSEAAVAALRDFARTAGATKTYLCVDTGDPEGTAAAEATVAQGAPGVDVSVVPVEPSLVLEDDSALLRVLEGRQAIPHVSVPPAAPPTLWGRPAAVLNLEDLVGPVPGAPATLAVTVWMGGEPLVAEVLETDTVREALRGVDCTCLEGDGAHVVRFGGSLGRFLAGSALDTPLGPATPWCAPVLETMPPGVCGVGALRDALRELSAASCGVCVACREGLRQLADMLAEVAESRAEAEVTGLMRELAAALEARSICGLGVAAADVLRTGLEAFAVDFRAHLDGAPCPEGSAVLDPALYAEGRTAALTIDGKPVEARLGSSVLEAALEAGIYVPHLCDHPDLPPAGACGLCVVEVEGTAEPVASCLAPVADGLVVATQSDRLAAVRRLAMELILATHPPECGSCEKYLNCELQSLKQYLGVEELRIKRHAKLLPVVSSNPLFAYDPNKCVLCGRCVRACWDVREVGVLHYRRKNGEFYVHTPDDVSLAEAACRFCGACTEVCPTGAIQDKEELLRDKNRKAALVPCRSACPAEIDVPRYVRLISEGDYAGAAAVVREKAPFPLVLGYVCDHPCEDECRRGEVNEAVAIRELKRFAAEQDDGSVWEEPATPKQDTGKRVAVVGSGPAGLTAAYCLRLQGHDVTVFEELPQPGGMLRYGIPEYRLPRGVLDREVGALVKAGVSIETGRRVESLDELLDQGYDAVLVAVGAHKGQRLRIPGAGSQGVSMGTEFLRAINMGATPEVGAKVLVLGGGNVAFDCARVARRLGAAVVRMACLECRDEMRASEEEIAQGEEEGIEILPSRTFTRVVAEDGRVTGVECLEVGSFCFGEDGRPEIDTIDASEHVVEADTVIFAIGQLPDLPEGFGLDTTDRRLIALGEFDLSTSREGVFAAGDAVTGTGSVIKAIASGRKAAEAVDKHLGGSGRLDRKLAPVVDLGARLGRQEGFAVLPRPGGTCMLPSERVTSFCEVVRGLEEDEARGESERCLRCDLRLKLQTVKFWGATDPRGTHDDLDTSDERKAMHMNTLPERVDVVVAGSGATGMAAALTLVQGGAKVAVFEKQRSLGGTSNFFQGTFAVESAMQRERYVDYTRDQAFKNTMDYSHWVANPRLVRAIVNESGATISWLQEAGVSFIEATINMPDSPLTYHTVKGRGEAVVKALVDQARAKGAQVFPGTPVVALLKEGGKTAGVVVDNDGEEVEVAAKAVVIATGGFANNKDWIKRYTGYDLGVNLFPVGNTGKTGDGVRMAWEAGAAEEGVETIEMFRVAPVGPEFAMGCHLEQAAAQPDLWVTARGERFCDETIGFYDTPVGNAQARYKADGCTFSILDDSIIERLMQTGLDKGVGIEYPPGYRLTNLRAEIEAALEHGSQEVFAAGSLDELAGLIGMEAAALTATVEEYNHYCAQGHDELFAKDARFLRLLVGPRFYAVRARAVFLGTMGGIKVTSRLEVVDKKDNVIPGLYAGGFDAGGMYGDSYPIKSSSGLASAFALNSGRIAGKSALAYLGR